MDGWAAAEDDAALDEVGVDVCCLPASTAVGSPATLEKWVDAEAAWEECLITFWCL